jgi:hypothetical protein
MIDVAASVKSKTMVNRTDAKNFHILAKGSADISLSLILFPFATKLKIFSYQMTVAEATGKKPKKNSLQSAF